MDTDFLPRWWRYYRHPVSDESIDLVCFPHAGAGASAYRRWPDMLSTNIAVRAIRYPGREDRIKEDPLTDIKNLADSIVDALDDHPRPRIFFGHSMGASIAHEVVLRLKAAGRPLPLGLVVSARPAPQLLSRHSYPDVADDEALLAEVSRLDPNGWKLLRHDELRAVVMPVLRADYGVVRSYRPEGVRPVPIPLAAFHGRDDPAVSIQDIDGWRENSTHSASVHTFPGGHFYLSDKPVAVLRTLDGIIGQWVDGGVKRS